MGGPARRHPRGRRLFGEDVLPPDEGAALGAEFDAEMDRPQAVVNRVKDPDPGE